MNVFYNKQGVGDVLLVQLTTEEPKSIKIEENRDVTLIRDEKTEELVAFNIFNASTYLKTDAVGKVDLNDDILEKIKLALIKNEVKIELTVDLSPKFVIGHVLKKESHPNADKLSVCTVDIGAESLQIVCGASNIDAGQKVVVAKVGAVMPSGMIIKDAELRGVPSSGMICSASELNLPNAEKGTGILVLEDDAKIGDSFNG
ncbi:YtpR family tRNA-binding protein [Sporosarcina sp. CAU 1771]